MLFYSIVVLAVLSGIITVISFVLYVRARMKEQEAKEQRFMRIHFLSLLLFVVLGVLILIMLSNMNL